MFTLSHNRNKVLKITKNDLSEHYLFSLINKKMFLKKCKRRDFQFFIRAKKSLSVMELAIPLGIKIHNRILQSHFQ